MNYATTSYLDKALKPLERIYRIWYANFAIRLWRSWLQCDATYNLLKNFVTPNIRDCIEINAHSLLLVMLALKEIKEEKRFLPWLMTSQSCEGFFRLLRSASPTSSTQTNFSTKNFALNRAKNADVSIRVKSQNIRDRLVYPRLKRVYEENTTYLHGENYLPNEEELEKSILQAQINVEKDLALLGNFRCCNAVSSS